jgi:hypothetical protein
MLSATNHPAEALGNKKAREHIAGFGVTSVANVEVSG